MTRSLIQLPVAWLKVAYGVFTLVSEKVLAKSGAKVGRFSTPPMRLRVQYRVCCSLSGSRQLTELNPKLFRKRVNSRLPEPDPYHIASHLSMNLVWLVGDPFKVFPTWSRS